MFHALAQLSTESLGENNTEPNSAKPQVSPEDVALNIIKLPEKPTIPKVTAYIDETGKKKYMIYIIGQIGNPALPMSKHMSNYQLVCNTLLTLPEGSEVDMYIDTPGGDVILACKLLTAMSRSRATITTIAAGGVMSAGIPIWCAGHKKVIYSNAIFMFHFSSHGDSGTSIGIAETADQLFAHGEMIMKPALELGLITQEEYESARAKNDVYIDAYTAIDRLQDKAQGVQ